MCDSSILHDRGKVNLTRQKSALRDVTEALMRSTGDQSTSLVLLLFECFVFIVQMEIPVKRNIVKMLHLRK